MSSQPSHQQALVGSGEMLSPEETAERLRQLEAWGVDLSLVEASLSRTPTERVTRMLELLAFGNALHEAYITQQGDTSSEGRGDESR